MGFFVRDLYLDSNRFRKLRITDVITRDPLTNPPTVPETSPIIAVAALSPRLVVLTEQVRGRELAEVAVHDAVQQVGGAAVSAMLPADDGSITDIPTPITPIVHRFDDTLRVQDLTAVRESLQQALKVVDGAVERLQPSAEDVDAVKAELSSALESLGR